MDIFFLIAGIILIVISIYYFLMSIKARNAYNSSDKQSKEYKRKLMESELKLRGYGLFGFLIGIMFIIIEIVRYYLNVL